MTALNHFTTVRRNQFVMIQDSEAAAPQVPTGAKDEAIAMVGEEQHAVDPAVEARAVRKIDLFLIPAMIFGCQ